MYVMGNCKTYVHPKLLWELTIYETTNYYLIKTNENDRRKSTPEMTCVPSFEAGPNAAHVAKEIGQRQEFI